MELFTNLAATVSRFRWEPAALLASVFLLFSGNAAAQTFINEDFSTATGTTPPTGWTNNMIQGDPGIPDLWHFNNPGSRSPAAPISGTFAVFDSDGLSFGGGAEDVALESPVFDATNATIVMLEFDQYFNCCTGGSADVEVWDGSSWVNVYSNNTTTTSNPDHQIIDISSEVSGVSDAQVRFRWTGDWSWYWIVDNVQVYSPLDDDVIVSSIGSLTSECGLGNETVSVTVENNGSLDVPANTTIPVSYQVNGGTVVTENLTLTSTLGNSQSATYTFSQLANLGTPGAYNVKAWTSWSSDMDFGNDTADLFVQHIPYVSSFPYNEGFETGPDGWTGTGSWEMGVPGQGFGAASGSTAWMTGLNGNYPNNANGYLYTPCFDFSNNRIPVLSFWLRINTEAAYDGAILEYTTDGTSWSKLGTNVPNFYTRTTNSFGPLPAPYWGGNNNNWTKYETSIRHLSGESYVRFRYRFASDGSVNYPGVAVDSFTVLDSCNFASGLPPVVDYQIPDSIFIGAPTIFYNQFAEQVAMNYSSHEWYVDGTQQSTSYDFRHTFSSTGTFEVKLRTQSCFGWDSVSKTVTVINPSREPMAAFIANKNLVEVYETVSLTDLSLHGASSWEWIIQPDSFFDQNFGLMLPRYTWLNGTNELSQNPVLSFDYPGTYSICLVASNSMGDDTLCVQDYVVVKATQNLCIFPFETTVPSGKLYDDGGPLGDYSNGHSGINACTYLIEPCASTVTLQLNAFDLETGVDFLRVYDGTDNTGTPLWNVAASPNGMTGNLTHSSVVDSLVSQSGAMYVEFETSSFTTRPGFEAEWTSTPGNFTPPVVDLDFPSVICSNILVDFENLTTGTGVNYRWDVGNNGTYESTSEDFSWSFQSPGTYQVALHGENCGGDVVAVKTVTVVSPQQAPNTGFYADILRPNLFEPVRLFDTTSYCVDNSTYSWNITPNTFNWLNGTDNTSMNPEVAFTAPGSYTVELSTANAAGTDVETKTSYITVLEYCQPLVASMSSDIGINDFMLETINNSSDAGVSAYTDFAGKLQTNLQIGGQYDVTMGRNTTNNPMNRAVWIDYNQDGDFVDAGELVASESSAFTASWTGTFTVPGSAMTGATRLRAGTNYGSLVNRPCGTNQFGEFEDYRVVITPDVSAPEIALIGPDTLYVPQCVAYVEDSATALDNVDGDISGNIIIDNSMVNTCVVDTYLVTYNVQDAAGNPAAEAVRTVIIMPDTVAPVITLQGNAVDTTDIYVAYTDPGYTAMDNIDGNLDAQVVVTGSVDTNHLGTYTLTYTVEDSEGNTTTAVRTVVVADREVPVLTLQGAQQDTVGICMGYTDPGVVAADNYDQNLMVTTTGSADTTVAGTYTIEYCVSDSSGNGPVCLTRTVVVEDTEAPQVLLVGSDTVEVEVFSEYEDGGIIVNDACNEDYSVSVTGTWNGETDRLGCYTMTYEVEDPSGNSDAVTRTICVVDETDPEIELLDELVVYLTRWTTWNDPQVAVSDNFDTNPTIEVGGNIDLSARIDSPPGQYFVTYQAVDQSGNRSEKLMRWVIVEASSVADAVEGAVVEVYPNPTQGQFTLKLQLAQREMVRISVLNGLGQEVQVVEEAQISGGTYPVSLEGERSGLYFVRVQTETGVIVKKVTLQR